MTTIIQNIPRCIHCDELIGINGLMITNTTQDTIQFSCVICYKKNKGDKYE